MNTLEGVWFSTSDLKLAVSLHAAGFPFKAGAECTRVVDRGRESFTWHFEGTNDRGEGIAEFVRQWELPAPEGTPRPDSLTVFLLAREVMFNRTHIISESHNVPRHLLLQRGDKRLMVTNRLGAAEKAKLAQLAS
jgi:hypothetical protein